MKKLFLLLMALFTLAQVKAQEKSVIQISTDNTDLILQVAPNGRLYQAYLGDKLLNEQDIKHFSEPESCYWWNGTIIYKGTCFLWMHKS